MATPRLVIDLKKIQHNTKWLVEYLDQKGISVTGVTKVALGNPDIAKSMTGVGVESIGDSRIENIQKMREAGIAAKYVLIRSPQLSKIDQVVKYADVSFNTELEILKKLSQSAQDQKKTHQVVLMIELGDLREGILPKDLEELVRQTLEFPNIQISGIGTNLACFGGVKPNSEKMTRLSELAQQIEIKFDIKLETVSGGNSANLPWVFDSEDTFRINNLRLGESIFLGCETLNRNPIEGLYTDAISLIAEVIESKIKPSVPEGDIGQDAFGSKPEFIDRGMINHSILGIGRQDVLVSGLMPTSETIEIFGASSDHVIVVSGKRRLQIGEEVTFHLSYGALVAAMTSPYVEKIYLS